jgi:hypothetical protein
MDRPAYELVRLLEDLLDDGDQVADSPEDPNNVRVWAVRAVLEDFGGKPHRWTPPRCGDCDHPFSLHHGECSLCDCQLTRREALNGRDESIDLAIEQVMREESTDGYLPRIPPGLSTDQ